MNYLRVFWRKQVRFRLLEVFVVWLLLATFAFSLMWVWTAAAFNGWQVRVIFGPERWIEGFLFASSLTGMCGWLIWKMYTSGDDPEIPRSGQGE